MKTASEWGGIIQDPGSEFTSFDAIAKAIQTEAQAELTEQVRLLREQLRVADVCSHFHMLRCRMLEESLELATLTIQKLKGQMNWDIPKDKNFPADAAQCDGCGGWGCSACEFRGWVKADSPAARKCLRDHCVNKIPPAQVAVYCSNECARLDA